MFYFSYLFSVIFLAFLVIIIIITYMASVFYLKYLIIIIYVRGVVVFILYISCMCWYVSNKFNYLFLFLGVFIASLYDLGTFTNWSDLGTYLWIYLFFRFLFNSLISGYSLNLFKVRGSLRF